MVLTIIFSGYGLFGLTENVFMKAVAVDFIKLWTIYLLAVEWKAIKPR